MKKYFFLSILFCSVLISRIYAQSGLKAGNVAPEFTATDNSGKTISLENLLKENKAVVLLFYRGEWCPYCNKYIKKLQDSLSSLREKGAYIVAVSPESSESISKTVVKTGASFSIIHDENSKIMKDYGVNYTVETSMLKMLNGYGVDLEKNNGNKNHVLPVPATYIIGQDHKIKYVQFNKDYKVRMSVSAIIAQL